MPIDADDVLTWIGRWVCVSGALLENGCHILLVKGDAFISMPHGCPHGNWSLLCEWHLYSDKGWSGECRKAIEEGCDAACFWFLRLHRSIFTVILIMPDQSIAFKSSDADRIHHVWFHLDVLRYTLLFTL